MHFVALAAAVLAVLPVAASGEPGPATAARRPVVVELFTSQGCSSCPPADALVAELADARPDILALTFHVTYWNRLGWTDPFSFQGATDRQRGYVALAISPQVYTPAMVVDGRLDVVGSDCRGVAAALAQAGADKAGGATVDVVRRGRTIAGSVGAGVGTGTVVLLGYDRRHETAVARGENGGRTLREVNIVRSMAVVGTWSGSAMQVEVPVPAGENAAVLVQVADGRIVGAGRAGS